jgi:hypothetical protein
MSEPRNEHDANTAMWTRPGLRLVNTLDTADFYAEEDKEASRIAKAKPKRLDYGSIARDVALGLGAVAGAALIIIGVLGVAGFFEVAR